jgi:hypothetical protein
MYYSLFKNFVARLVGVLLCPLSIYRFNQKYLLLKIYLTGVVLITIVPAVIFVYVRIAFPQFSRPVDLEAVLNMLIFWQQRWLFLLAVILIPASFWYVVRRKVFYRLHFILGLVALFLSIVDCSLPNWLVSVGRQTGVFAGKQPYNPDIENR